MSNEELTAEEQEAMAAMQQDDTPVEEPKEPDTRPDPVEEVEAAQEEVEAAQEEVEAAQTDQPEKQEETPREKPPEGFVPHQALHAEREARKELQRRLDELAANMEAQQNPPEKEPEWVDPIEDPEGHRKWVEHNNTTTREQVEALQNERRQQVERQQMVQEVSRLEQEFAAKTPDYAEAVQTLHQARVSALRNAGWSDQEISQQVANDANSIYQAARQIGMNPAQLLYMRAQEAGYKPKPKVDASEGQKIEALASAQKQTQGLGSVGGGEQKGQLTVAQLAEMSEAELAKIPEEDIARVMGG